VEKRAVSEALETLKKAEDKVATTIETFSELELWVLYQALYNSGHRIADAPHRIRTLVKS
jgi:vacuolar-type H+-ATPase subunit H